MPTPEEKPDDREQILARIDLDPNQLAFVSERVKNPPEPSARLLAAFRQHARK